MTEVNLPSAMPTVITAILYSPLRPMSFTDDLQLWDTLEQAFQRNSIQPGDAKGVVILNSLGGQADTAYKMANVLRHFFCGIDIVVPYQAKSAATLLCLCADRVVMGPLSELGPLDVQTQHPGTEASWVSGIDIVQALDKTITTSLIFSDRAAFQMRRGPGIGRKDALQLGLEFGASVVQGLISQIDPITVFAAERMLMTASEYGRRLLKRYMLKDKQDGIDELIKKLINNYPTHSFVIDLEEASALGLNVVSAHDYPIYDFCGMLHDSWAPLKASEMVVQARELSEFRQDTATGSSACEDAPEQQEQGEIREDNYDSDGQEDSIEEVTVQGEQPSPSPDEAVESLV